MKNKNNIAFYVFFILYAFFFYCYRIRLQDDVFENILKFSWTLRTKITL